VAIECLVATYGRIQSIALSPYRLPQVIARSLGDSSHSTAQSKVFPARRAFSNWCGSGRWYDKYVVAGRSSNAFTSSEREKTH